MRSTTTLAAATTFGDLLRQLRRRNGMTQDELAALVGFSRAQLSRLEQNERLPNLAVIAEKFAPALGLQTEPHLAQRLLELAAAARGERPPAAIRVTRTVQTTVQEQVIDHASPLPTPPTLLVGRERTLRALSKRLLEAPGRLVTLVGPPGVGKTRLALAVAAELQDFFADGAHLVPLAATSDPDLVASTLIASLGVTETSAKPPVTRLVTALRRKELLLVLDNFEQVIAAAPLIAEILEQCAGLRVLVTSREPLRLRGEQRFKTPPLEPAAAVELFVQRAQAINPDFALTPETGAIVAQICLQLDGLPLAIELAAARSELFTPHQLLEQLQHGRLDLLEAGARDLPERQRTLRTAIAWSYRLLSPAAQRLLRGLAVFVSGFDLESMQAVVGDEAIPTAELLSQLQTLVASSLVVAQEVAGSRRYLLLETIREYGWEQAALHQELHTLHSRHAAYFVQWTEAQVPRQFLREEGVWWQPLAREQENLRAALAWSLQCNGEQALRLAVALHPFWDTRGEQREGSRWLAQALALNPQPSLLRAQGLRKAGTFAQQRMDFQPAAQLLDEALAIFRMASDQDGEAETLRAWGWLAWTMSDALRAHECFAKSLSIFRQLDNRLMMATVLSNLVHVLSYSNAPYVQTRAYAEESLLIFRELGQQHGIALALRQRGIDELRVGNYGAAVTALTEAMEIWQRRGGQRELAWTREALGEAYWLLGHVATAASHWTESLTMFQTMDEEFGMMVVFHHLGQVERNHCQWARATHYYRLALHYFWKLDTPHFVARCLAGLGGVALAQGQPAHATQLLASAYQLFERLPPFLAPGDQADYERLVEQARNALGEVEFCAAWETGARLNTEQAVQLGQRAEASE